MDYIPLGWKIGVAKDMGMTRPLDSTSRRGATSGAISRTSHPIEPPCGRSARVEIVELSGGYRAGCAKIMPSVQVLRRFHVI